MGLTCSLCRTTTRLASPLTPSPPSLRTSGSIARRDAALMGVVTAEPVVRSSRMKNAIMSSSTWKDAKPCRLEYTSSYPSVLVSRSRPPPHHTFGHRIFRLGPLASGNVLGDGWLTGFEDIIMAWVRIFTNGYGAAFSLALTLGVLCFRQRRALSNQCDNKRMNLFLNCS
jgi:hypothetical protein